MGLSLQSEQSTPTVSLTTIKIITEGRVSKLPHVAEVRFVCQNGSFFVLAGDERSDWVLNALKSKRAKVRTGEFVYVVDVRNSSEEERSTTLEEFTSKYGSRVVNDWYSEPGACLRLTPVGVPTQRGAVKGEGNATSTYADWVAKEKEYYPAIAQAFDSASEEYDFTISHNYINTWIRKRSIAELLEVSKPEDTLVEIGCGTGAEAVEISKHVSQIIATDISNKMLEILAKKIQARRLSKKIIPFQAKASEIKQVAPLVEGGRAQVAYSFNGALNCEPDLQQFGNNLSSVLTPGGYFLCSVRNSFCLGEALAHAAVLQFDRMTPRKKQPVMVSVGGMDIPAFYYRPERFTQFFTSRFRIRKIIGLPAFLPPAYLNDYYLKFKNVASILEKCETVLGSHFPFNRFGDQTLFVFQNL
jgi:ubiquinone/menaquinone biosynthesis C-methylase UbiE